MHVREIVHVGKCEWDRLFVYLSLATGYSNLPGVPCLSPKDSDQLHLTHAPDEGMRCRNWVDRYPWNTLQYLLEIVLVL